MTDTIKPRPTVWCYAQVIDTRGAELIRRFTFDGSDHQAAAQRASDYLRTSDVRMIETFDGEPRRWHPHVNVSEVAT